MTFWDWQVQHPWRAVLSAQIGMMLAALIVGAANAHAEQTVFRGEGAYKPSPVKREPFVGVARCWRDGRTVYQDRPCDLGWRQTPVDLTASVVAHYVSDKQVELAEKQGAFDVLPRLAGDVSAAPATSMGGAIARGGGK